MYAVILASAYVRARTRRARRRSRISKAKRMKSTCTSLVGDTCDNEAPLQLQEVSNSTAGRVLLLCGRTAAV